MPLPCAAAPEPTSEPRKCRSSLLGLLISDPALIFSKRPRFRRLEEPNYLFLPPRLFGVPFCLSWDFPYMLVLAPTDTPVHLLAGAAEVASGADLEPTRGCPVGTVMLVKYGRLAKRDMQNTMIATNWMQTGI
ncbi:hypothetical protein COLO4_08781 [Corchorus olitorius]|uniref:Uncharacterized protein n=1 Tax=Corchorus olitorius TaxID=93759 RepID=A0A1R3KEN0_9ROSI|nr:hypothetical protein COLO4_08781 [Corchorus olitorius]